MFSARSELICACAHIGAVWGEDVLKDLPYQPSSTNVLGPKEGQPEATALHIQIWGPHGGCKILMICHSLPRDVFQKQTVAQFRWFLMQAIVEHMLQE